MVSAAKNFLSRVNREHLVLLASLIIINLIVYFNIFNSFLWSDDFAQYTGHRFFFRPLYFLFLDLYSKIFHLGVPFCYLLLFFAHLTSAVFVYVLFEATGGSKRFSFMGACLFITYLSNWEAVGWTSSIYYPIYVILLVSFLKASETRSKFLPAFFYLLGLMSHESAVIFLPILIAYRHFFGRRQDLKGLFDGFFPLFALTAIYFIFRGAVETSSVSAGIGAGQNIAARFLFNQLNYMSSVFVPFITTYKKSALFGGSLINFIAGLKIAALAFMAFMLYLSFKFRSGLIKFYLFWIAIAVAPFALVSFSMTSRYLYVASVGAVALITFVLDLIIRGRKTRYLGIGLFIAVFMFNLIGMSFVQKMFWHKKEVRREILNQVELFIPDIDHGEAVCFIDLPIRHDEIDGMLSLFFPDKKLVVCSINDDNTLLKKSPKEKIGAALEKSGRVFIFDTDSSKLVPAGEKK